MSAADMSWEPKWLHKHSRSNGRHPLDRDKLAQIWKRLGYLSQFIIGFLRFFFQREAVPKKNISWICQGQRWRIAAPSWSAENGSRHGEVFETKLLSYKIEWKGIHKCGMLKEHVAKDFSNYIKRIFWDSWNLINIYFLNVGIWTFWRKVTPWHLKDYVQNTAIPALAQTPLLGGCSSPGIERVNDGVKIWHGIDLFSDVSSSILFDPFANFVLLVLSVELLQTFAGQVSNGVFTLRPTVLLPQLVGASPGQILLGVRNGAMTWGQSAYYSMSMDFCTGTTLQDRLGDRKMWSDALRFWIDVTDVTLL